MGTALLLLGFVLQFLGAHNVHQAFVDEALLVLLAVFLTCYVLFIRKLVTDYQLRKADEFAVEWKEEGKAEGTK